MNSRAILATAVACLCGSALQSARAGDLTWFTVVDNSEPVPETTKSFNSYNQPAINKDGTVVFRARSKGGEGSGPMGAQPEHGIYVRHFDAYAGEFRAISTVFNRGVPVPEPVSPGESGALPTFNMLTGIALTVFALPVHLLVQLMDYFLKIVLQFQMILTGEH